MLAKQFQLVTQGKISRWGGLSNGSKQTGLQQKLLLFKIFILLFLI